MVNISERAEDYRKSLDMVLRHFFDENGRKFGGEGAKNYDSLVRLKENLERQLIRQGQGEYVSDLFIWGIGEENFFILPESISGEVVSGFLVSDGVRRRIEYSYSNTIGRFPPKDSVGIFFSTEIENLQRENILGWVISQGISEEELNSEIVEDRALSRFETFKLKELPDLFDTREGGSSIVGITEYILKDDRI